MTVISGFKNQVLIHLCALCAFSVLFELINNRLPGVHKNLDKMKNSIIDG